MHRFLIIDFPIKASKLFFVAAILLVHSLFGQHQKSDNRSKGPDFIAKSNAMILKNEIYSEDFFDAVMESGKCSSTDEDKVRYYVNFGIALLAKGSYSLALDKFERALEIVQKQGLDYDTELIEFNIAIVKIGLKSYEEALNSLNKLPEAKYANFGYYYYRGMAQMAMNRWNEAIASFEQDLKTQANPGRTHYAFAGLYAKLNDWEKALEHIQQTEVSYDRIDEFLLFGNVHLFSHGIGAASKYFKQIEDAADKFTSYRKSNEKKISVLGNPIPFSSLSYHLVRSVSLAASGDGGAVQRLKEDKSALTHYCTLFTLANDYFKMGNFREAEVYFKKAIDKNKNDALAYLGLGIAQLKQDEYNDAIIQFSKAISENRDLLPAYEARLLAYYILERYEECIADYAAVRFKDPTYRFGYDALVCVGFYKFSFGFQEEARRLFEQAIDRFPEECGGYAGLGIYLMQYEQDAPKALKVFNQAISKDRTESLGYVNRANSLYTLSNDVRYNDIRNRKRRRYVRRANRDFDRAIEMDPTSAAAYNGKAMLVLKELMAEAIQIKGKNQDSQHWKLEFAKVDSLVQMALNANRADERSTQAVRSRTEYSIILNHAFMVGSMATAFTRMNNVEMASQLLEKSESISRQGISLSPNDSASFWLNYSVSCSGVQVFDKAIDAVNKAMDDENLCAAQNNIAYYYFNKGLIDSAETSLNSARDCFAASPQHVELIERNIQFIHGMAARNENYTVFYDYEPILDWRPANLRFNLTIPPYRFEPNVLLILQNLAIDNRSDGPCVIQDRQEAKPPRFKDFKPDEDTVPPCPGSNRRKKIKT
jgi:tetratricopeptide (TPR) repeat protein